MKCYQHSATDAYGCCKNCQKGVCAECASLTENYLSCNSDYCNTRIREDLMLIQHAKKAYGIAKKSFSALSYTSIFLLVLGILLLAQGVLLGEDMSAVLLSSLPGIIFIGFGLWMYTRYRPQKIKTNDSNDLKTP